MDILVYGFILFLVFGANAWREHDRKVAELDRQRRIREAQEQRYQKSHLADIDSMAGLDFEYSYACPYKGKHEDAQPAMNDGTVHELKNSRLDNFDKPPPMPATDKRIHYYL